MVQLLEGEQEPDFAVIAVRTLPLALESLREEAACQNFEKSLMILEEEEVVAPPTER